MARYAVWASTILSSIGIILLAVCIGTNSWVSRKRSAFQVTEGLFYRCVENTSQDGLVKSSCEKIYSQFSDFPVIYIVILSLMFGACLLQLFNFIVSMCSFLLDSALPGVMCALETLTIVAAIGGLSTYVRYYDNKYYRFDWSYIVGWVGVCFIAVAMVSIIVGIERRKHTVY